MRVHPVAISVKEIMPYVYGEYYHKHKDNPMRCVIVNMVTKDRTYIDGYFVSIRYVNNDSKLVIDYICERMNAGMVGIPTMDSHCFVTYMGKEYRNMFELYKDFENDKLIKEIDKALT